MIEGDRISVAVLRKTNTVMIVPPFVSVVCLQQSAAWPENSPHLLPLARSAQSPARCTAPSRRRAPATWSGSRDSGKTKSMAACASVCRRPRPRSSAGRLSPHRPANEPPQPPAAAGQNDRAAREPEFDRNLEPVVMRVLPKQPSPAIAPLEPTDVLGKKMAEAAGTHAPRPGVGQHITAGGAGLETLADTHIRLCRIGQQFETRDRAAKIQLCEGQRPPQTAPSH